MYTFKIEELPHRMRSEIEDSIQEHPQSAAARLRPLLGCNLDGWRTFVGWATDDIRPAETPLQALQEFELLQSHRGVMG